MLYARTFIAEGAITVNRLVRFSPTVEGQVVQSAAVTDRIAGVYVGPGNAANGDTVQVCMLGECNLEVSGAVGRGSALTTNASGQGVTAAPAAGTNNKIAAVALIAGSSNTIPVLVVPSSFQG